MLKLGYGPHRGASLDVGFRSQVAPNTKVGACDSPMLLWWWIQYEALTFTPTGHIQSVFGSGTQVFCPGCLEFPCKGQESGSQLSGLVSHLNSALRSLLLIKRPL